MFPDFCMRCELSVQRTCKRIALKYGFTLLLVQKKNVLVTASCKNVFRGLIFMFLKTIWTVSENNLSLLNVYLSFFRIFNFECDARLWKKKGDPKILKKKFFEKFQICIFICGLHCSKIKCTKFKNMFSVCRYFERFTRCPFYKIRDKNFSRSFLLSLEGNLPQCLDCACMCTQKSMIFMNFSFGF